MAGGILVEAAALAVAGSMLGLALGVGLAVLLLRAVESWGMPISGIEYSAVAVIAAVVTGVIATLRRRAAWPAVRAARIPPIQALTGSGSPRRRLGRRQALVSLALFVPGVVFGGLFTDSGRPRAARSSVSAAPRRRWSCSSAWSGSRRSSCSRSSG